MHEGNIVTVQGRIMHELKASEYPSETATILPECIY